MVLKIFRAVWFLSVLAVLANLLYIYATLPELVVLQDDGLTQVSVNREGVFYFVAIMLALVNVLVYVIAKFFPREEDFRAWFHGLIITLNVFFIVAISLIGLYNSTEIFDYSRIGFVIYGSLGLILIWAVSWPIYRLIQRLSIKHSV
ncbi:MAG: hypothetical protein JNM57_02460 [Cyclobacteriaceae bacterium]|nr:hypothetical protein [Cyclobacteriaceae bacterium]